MSRRWVTDASPIILLAKTGRLDLLSACTEELLIPEAVAEEVRQAPDDDPACEWIGADGERFVGPTSPVASEVAAWDLGRGENHVLSYALSHPEWTAVVDDGAARRSAQGLDISVIGTLGVLVVAKRNGHLEAVRPAAEALRRASLHVSQDVMDHVLRVAGEA